MRNFISKTIVLIIVPAIIYICIWQLLINQYSHKINEYETFILGDSQTEFINIKGVYNRSILGSPYYVHYEFAKQFIDQIKGKKVYITCNYHNLSKLYQNRLANDTLVPGWRANTFKNLNDYNLYNHKFKNIRPTDLSYTFFDIKKMPKLAKHIFIPFENVNTSKDIVNDTISIINAIDRHWHHPKYILEDSIQKNYLNKLIVFLKENNCEVVLIKMPLTNYYKNNVPSEIKENIALLPNKFQIELLDLDKELNISNRYDYFKDFGHLNSKGDSLISVYFEEFQ